MNPFAIVKRVWTSEKGGYLAGYNKYIFEVDKKANKIQIREAVEKIYNVKVKSVATIKMPSKPRRLRWWESGRTPESKKAIVTLKEGYKIE